MIWRIFIILALLAVAAASLFSRRQRPDELPSLSSPEPVQPGYFMTDATVLQTSPSGLPLYRMTADRIQQNPKDLSIRLDRLSLVYTAETSNPWTLTADSGFVKSLDSRTIDLQGNVRIAGTPPAGAAEGADAPSAVIRTSRLQVDAAASTATTRERVDIEWGNRVFSATGLKADLKAERLTLESKVHGRFTR